MIRILYEVNLVHMAEAANTCLMMTLKILGELIT